MQRFLMQMANIVIGGFVAFNASVEIMNNVYFAGDNPVDKANRVRLK